MTMYYRCMSFVKFFRRPGKKAPGRPGPFWFAAAVLIWAAAPAFAEYAEGMELYRRAWAAYAAHRYEEARGWAERAVRADPENAHALSLLGEVAYLRHDLAGAAGSWKRAAALNAQMAGPLGRQIEQVETETALEGELEPVELGGLVVRVPRETASTAPAGSLRSGLLADLGRAVEELEPLFQHRVSRPLTVLIYPRERFYEGMHLPTEVLGLFDGKIRIPAGPGGGRPSAAVLRHEYAHAVVHDLSRGRAPRWLHEGLAQECEEGGPAPPGFEMPPLRALWGISERPGQPVILPAGQFYAASHGLVRFLLEARGWDRMRRLLAELGRGRPEEEALQALYGWDLAALEEKWRKWYHSRKMGGEE